MNPFNEKQLPTPTEIELKSYLDPRQNNVGNFRTGQRVIVTQPTFGDETRTGFVAKQLDPRHFLVKLEYPFSKFNRHTVWLTVCRDYAHQLVEEI